MKPAAFGMALGLLLTPTGAAMGEDLLRVGSTRFTESYILGEIIAQPILAAVGVIQTIPSLALLAFLISLLGSIGTLPALIALFLYSLLPIVRNTHAGIEGVGQGMREAALALGLVPRDRLLLIELPLAAPSILAGIKTSAVIGVGTATIAAFIGAGGLWRAHRAGIGFERQYDPACRSNPGGGIGAVNSGRIRADRALRVSGAASAHLRLHIRPDDIERKRYARSLIYIKLVFESKSTVRRSPPSVASSVQNHTLR